MECFMLPIPFHIGLFNLEAIHLFTWRVTFWRGNFNPERLTGHHLRAFLSLLSYGFRE